MYPALSLVTLLWVGQDPGCVALISLGKQGMDQKLRAARYLIHSHQNRRGEAWKNIGISRFGGVGIRKICFVPVIVAIFPPGYVAWETRITCSISGWHRLLA